MTELEQLISQCDMEDAFERRLRAGLLRLQQVESALDEWFDKTAWVQETVQIHELGMHRADVLKSRIDALNEQVNRLLLQLFEQSATNDEPVATAWDEGYRAGVNDERMSEANIGIAGFGMKVEPARNNPYRSGPQPAGEPVACRHKEQHKEPIFNHAKAVVGYSEWKDGEGDEGWWPHRTLYICPQQAAQYDQQSLELCEKCGWKTVIPDDGCLNCERKPAAQRQPLTNWQIEAVAKATNSAEPGRDGYVLPHAFARAIEAAHGIG